MKFKKFLTIFSVIVLVLGAYCFGYLIGHADLQFEKGYIPKIEKIEIGKPQDIDFSLFWKVWNLVEDKYYGPTDKWKMFYGAIKGMIEGLEDPYTAFMDPENTSKFLEEIKGEFEGVGIEITQREGKIVIISPLEGSPAQRAGLKPGDRIEKVDGRETSTMNIDEVVSAIRGKKGTEVILAIEREGVEKLLEFKITRALIKIESVKWEMKEDIAYLKISQFIEDTERLAQKAASSILKGKPKGIILDLRNNPGGYMEKAVSIASLFIKEGVIAIEEGKGGKKEEFKAQGQALLSDLPLIVLINQGSASGSEIVAGAIRDHKRGLLLGEKTFGKGTVQSLEELEGGSSLRLTVAKWLTPNNLSINEQGLEPDIKVKFTEEDEKAQRDPQLERALKELRK